MRSKTPSGAGKDLWSIGTAGKLDQLLDGFARAEDGDVGQDTVRHRDFVAVLDAGADLAVFVDLVRQCGTIFDDEEARVGEELRKAGEEADAADTVLLGLFEQRLQEVVPAAAALPLGADDYGADLRQMRPIEVERAAALELA